MSSSLWLRSLPRGYGLSFRRYGDAFVGLQACADPTTIYAVEKRISVRAFRPEPPPSDVVKSIIENAARSPSGGNLQPWRVHVLGGDALKALVADVAAVIAENPRSEKPEYAVYPQDLWEPLRTRRFQAGEDLYATLQIPREDKLGRLAQFSNNFRLFGAPIGKRGRFPGYASALRTRSGSG
eukprot:gene17032-17221_t